MNEKLNDNYNKKFSQLKVGENFPLLRDDGIINIMTVTKISENILHFNGCHVLSTINFKDNNHYLKTIIEGKTYSFFSDFNEAINGSIPIILYQAKLITDLKDSGHVKMHEKWYNLLKPLREAYLQLNEEKNENL